MLITFREGIPEGSWMAWAKGWIAMIQSSVLILFLPPFACVTLVFYLTSLSPSLLSHALDEIIGCCTDYVNVREMMKESM